MIHYTAIATRCRELDEKIVEIDAVLPLATAAQQGELSDLRRQLWDELDSLRPRYKAFRIPIVSRRSQGDPVSPRPPAGPFSRQGHLEAIETHYNGHRFRSRIEARWAVFFDELGVEWEYEKEGYTLSDGTKYLPDFWLPESATFVEVKGAPPTTAERQTAATLARDSGKSVLLVWGTVAGRCLVAWSPAEFELLGWEGKEEADFCRAAIAARRARFEHTL